MCPALNIPDIFELVNGSLEDRSDILSMVLACRKFYHSTHHLDRHIDTHERNKKAWDYLKPVERAEKVRELFLKLIPKDGETSHEPQEDYGLAETVSGMKRLAHLKLWKEERNPHDEGCIARRLSKVIPTIQAFRTLRTLEVSVTILDTSDVVLLRKVSE